MEKLKRIYQNYLLVQERTGLREIASIAAGTAFWFFLSLVPMVILAVSILPYTALREEQLLHYLARHPGTALTRARLLREVWGYNSDDDPSRTVDSHVKTLRLKLGDDADSPRFIQTVRGTGYRLIAGEKG